MKESQLYFIIANAYLITQIILTKTFQALLMTSIMAIICFTGAMIFYWLDYKKNKEMK